MILAAYFLTGALIGGFLLGVLPDEHTDGAGFPIMVLCTLLWGLAVAASPLIGVALLARWVGRTLRDEYTKANEPTGH